MNALLSILGSVGIFVAGLVVRLGLLAAVLLILTTLFLVGYGAVRLVVALRRSILGLGVADGVSWKRKGYYAPGHTWIESLTGQALRLGVDDLGQKVLGHVTALTLPVPGTKLREGEPLTQVACGNRHVAIPSPVTGTVVAINDAVIRDPGLIHRDPYRRGWLVSLDAANAAYARLPWGNAARRWLHEESVRLSHFMEQSLQLHAADGGEYVAPGPSFLDDAQWRTMVKAFLKAD